MNCSTSSAIKTAGRVEAQPPHEISTVFYCRDLELELPSEFFVKEKEKDKDQTRDEDAPVVSCRCPRHAMGLLFTLPSSSTAPTSTSDEIGDRPEHGGGRAHDLIQQPLKEHSNAKDEPGETELDWSHLDTEPRVELRERQPVADGDESSVHALGRAKLKEHHAHLQIAELLAGAAGRTIEDEPLLGILDSGAQGRHYLGKDVNLVRVRRVPHGVKFANGATEEVTNVGDFELRAVDENGNELEPLMLKNASVLEASPFNLVSVGLLCDEGSIFHLERGNSWFTYKGARFPIEEREGLFIIRLDRVLQGTLISELENLQSAGGHRRERYKVGTETYCCAATFDMWHERFGHMSHKRLKVLYESGNAEGMAVEGGKWKHDRKCKCSTCMAINNERVHVGDHRQFSDLVTFVGQSVVADVSGPFPDSIEGYKYVVSFTDVYSRFSCCYFLKAKSDCEEALKSFIAFYRQHGYVVKELRSDAGGEFGGGNERAHVEADADGANDEGFVFSRVCKEHGIAHVATPARKPELHGLAENWNRVVIRIANSLLYSARISHILWAAAVGHANYLKNRSPNRHLGGLTSYELFYHKRPRVSDLRIWGCDAWELLPAGQVLGQANRKRLIYVGHAPDRIGWRCFDPVDMKFNIRFELIFNELSAKKRICALREFDRRRTSAR